MLNPVIEAEIAELATAYQQPRRLVVDLSGQPFSPVGESDRYGEVCMVIRRTNGRLLTAIKTFYPDGAFRLLTGGIHHGERVEAALQREIWEETGLEVIITRFLAVIEYQLRGVVGTHSAFATFAFLLDERGGTLVSHDPGEQLAAFGETAPNELFAMAAMLANLGPGYSPDLDGDWQDWGRFRAVVHHVVGEILAETEDYASF